MTSPASVTPRPEMECLQLKIELAWIVPVIWRRIVVPETIKLCELHQVIQTVMGWDNSHLHEFKIGDERYGPPAPYSDETLPESRHSLGAALGKRKTCKYIYDFGDHWEHRIKLEKRLSATPENRHRASCLAGANAAPPEDIGGAPGYADFCEAIADPQHPDHEEMLDWCGEGFDPGHFDLDAINCRLSRLKL